MSRSSHAGVILLVCGILLGVVGRQAPAKDDPKPDAERIKVVRAMYEKLPCDILNFAEPVKKTPEFLADTNGEVLRMTLVDAGGVSLTIQLDNQSHAISISTPARHTSMGVVVGAPKAGDGVLVAQVAAGSPAEAAGLKAGDVIVKAEGDPLKDAGQLRQLLTSKKPGDKITVAIQRDGKEQNIDVTLGSAGGGAFDPLMRLPARGPEESAVYGLLLRLNLPAPEKDSAAEILKVLDERFAGALPGQDK